jgi:hypothetical protein
MTGTYDGAIVLGLLVVLLVIGLAKLRRRIPVPWTTGGVVAVFVLVVLMLWALSQG